MTTRRRKFRHRAMTLMETVIAVGVIGFAVPLVLAATAASLDDRRQAETETRAAWLAAEIAREVSARWANPVRPHYLPDSLETRFPAIGSDAAPWVLLYDGQGNFLEPGQTADIESGSRNPRAVYLATVKAAAHQPANLKPQSNALSRVTIQIQQPARAPLANRRIHPFSTILRETTLN